MAETLGKEGSEKRRRGRRGVALVKCKLKGTGSPS